MRFLGHPVHVILVHFPIALWPAHTALHFAAAWLPAGAATLAGFWLLAAGTALGWLATVCGAADLLALSRDPAGHASLRTGLIHAALNGTAVLGFTALTIVEATHYPDIALNRLSLALETLAVLAMFVGNYFGGALVWGKTPVPR